MKPIADPAVIAWLNANFAANFYITAITLAELLAGIALIPRGRRREGLQAKHDEVIAAFGGSRILPFDVDAAHAYAGLHAHARAAGYTISLGDGQIAAIAKVRNFAVATRDTAPFIAAGLRVINPWDAGAA